MSKHGHALRRATVNGDNGLVVYRWTCECGEAFGQQPAMSVHKVRRIHRDHKAQAVAS